MDQKPLPATFPATRLRVSGKKKLALLKKRIQTKASRVRIEHKSGNPNIQNSRKQQSLSSMKTRAPSQENFDEDTPKRKSDEQIREDRLTFDADLLFARFDLVKELQERDNLQTIINTPESSS